MTMVIAKSNSFQNLPRSAVIWTSSISVKDETGKKIVFVNGVRTPFLLSGTATKRFEDAEVKKDIKTVSYKIKSSIGDVWVQDTDGCKIRAFVLTAKSYLNGALKTSIRRYSTGPGDDSKKEVDVMKNQNEGVHKNDSVENNWKSKYELMEKLYKKKEDDLIAEVETRKEAQVQLASLEDNLTFVRCRAAIEDFEDNFGQKAVINKPSGPSYSAYTKEVRRQRWVWILKNCTHEYQVQDLQNKINESPYFKDVEDFTDGISRGYDQLSKLIKQKVLAPGTGDYHYRYTTANSKANRAIEAFMDIFEIKKEIVIPKNIGK